MEILECSIPEATKWNKLICYLFTLIVYYSFKYYTKFTPNAAKTIVTSNRSDLQSRVQFI